jgi:Transglycosylase SLT domain
MRSRTTTPLAVMLAAMIAVTLVGCSGSTRSPIASTSTAAPAPVATMLPAQPLLTSDPALLAADLTADEQTLRDPSSSEAALLAAAHRQQVTYRALGRNPEWDPIVRPGIPPSLLETYDRNVDARRQLTALSQGEAKATPPAWPIEPPAPADMLLGYYHDAEAASGVGWNYLAAINLIETCLGRIAGVSSAGAEGPMQFLPSTFAKYGDGGDIRSPHDSIMAAGRFLAANGFADDHGHAIFGYNHSSHYVSAVEDYAAVLASDPAAFAGYYRWDVYYYTSSDDDVLLPAG